MRHTDVFPEERQWKVHTYEVFLAKMFNLNLTMRKQLDKSRLWVILRKKTTCPGSFKKCQYHERLKKRKKAGEQSRLKGTNTQDNQVEHDSRLDPGLGRKTSIKDILGYLEKSEYLTIY